MSDCPYRDRWFSRCLFEARYDLGAPEIPENATRISVVGDDDLLELFRPKRYVRDVCIHCGRTIERDNKEAQP